MLNTIIAVVAVLEIHIDNKHVIIIKASISNLGVEPANNKN